MGVAVSNYRLARAVSLTGGLGVVSGTMLDTVLARRLQDGDPNGVMRRAILQFPFPEIARRVLKTYFNDGGRQGKPYKLVPMFSSRPSTAHIELTMLANFVEVLLAKEGHTGSVGINLLTKIELPTVPSLFGAMLAGVDYVLMGAGIPRAIPGILDKLSTLKPVSLKLEVDGAERDEAFFSDFDPSQYADRLLRALKRPLFLAIVSSFTLAQALARKASGAIDGFVVEHHTAGGHNAPPRGGINLDENGEPIYGPKDEIDLESFRKLGLPFWLAGSYASPERVVEAVSTGAQGIQAGTIFAFSRESGISADIKAKVIEQVLSGKASVFTDPNASASGYPFKIVQVDGTLSDLPISEERPRICDLGYLRTAYKREDGTVGFRCPAEPVETYLAKGGKLEDTVGKKCLCNGLMATVGYAQSQSGGLVEPPLVTAGEDLHSIARLLSGGSKEYSAAEAIRYLLRDLPVHQSCG